MTLAELLITLISIMFIFDTATINITHLSFSFLLFIYILSVIEISFFSFIIMKIKRWWK